MEIDIRTKKVSVCAYPRHLFGLDRDVPIANCLGILVSRARSVSNVHLVIITTGSNVLQLIAQNPILSTYTIKGAYAHGTYQNNKIILVSHVQRIMYTTM
jgi:hypothetical protein